MKKFLILFFSVLLIAGCYDDAALTGRVNDLEDRVSKLEELCNQMNTNISSLQTIVNALQNKDYVTSVAPVMSGGKEIGYTINFSKSKPITIYHGKNGEDGKDGHTPVIGVKQHTDGIYYWTLDGEWLLDDRKNKIKAEGTEGKDGITPKLKIENDYWYISYNNGSSWTRLGKATGEDGESFFKDVTQDEDYIHFTLQDGNIISVPIHKPLSVSFSNTEDIRVIANKTYKIAYTITGADDRTVIKALAQDGFMAVVKKSDNATGVIEITTPDKVQSSEVLVFVSDGNERTIMRSINFFEGVIIIASKSFSAPYDGGTVEVELSTNIDYTVEIPEVDKAWISVSDIKTKAEMRNETITFEVKPNQGPKERYSTIKLIDKLGVKSETVLIIQQTKTYKSIHVATAGTLGQMLSEEDRKTITKLKITGHLNIDDYNLLNNNMYLQTLDLSELSDEHIPDRAFFQKSYIVGRQVLTILLPINLVTIGEYAFFRNNITFISIPETLLSIGKSAFCNL